MLANNDHLNPLELSSMRKRKVSCSTQGGERREVGDRGRERRRERTRKKRKEMRERIF